MTKRYERKYKPAFTAIFSKENLLEATFIQDARTGGRSTQLQPQKNIGYQTPRTAILYDVGLTGVNLHRFYS